MCELYLALVLVVDALPLECDKHPLSEVFGRVNRPQSRLSCALPLTMRVVARITKLEGEVDLTERDAKHHGERPSWGQVVRLEGEGDCDRRILPLLASSESTLKMWARAKSRATVRQRARRTVMGSLRGSSCPGMLCTFWLNHVWPPVNGRIGSVPKVKWTGSQRGPVASGKHGRYDP